MNIIGPTISPILVPLVLEVLSAVEEGMLLIGVVAICMLTIGVVAICRILVVAVEVIVELGSFVGVSVAEAVVEAVLK